MVFASPKIEKSSFINNLSQHFACISHNPSFGCTLMSLFILEIFCDSANKFSSTNVQTISFLIAVSRVINFVNSNEFLLFATVFFNLWNFCGVFLTLIAILSLKMTCHPFQCFASVGLVTNTWLLAFLTLVVR